MKPGSIVRKKPGAGFVGEPLLVRVPDPATWSAHDLGTFEENIEPCFICDNPECREFANVEAVDIAGRSRGWIYHLSECQMESIDPASIKN